MELSVGRRILSWTELGIGGLLLAAGACSIGLGILTGHREDRDGTSNFFLPRSSA